MTDVVTVDFNLPLPKFNESKPISERNRNLELSLFVPEKSLDKRTLSRSGTAYDTNLEVCIFRQCRTIKHDEKYLLSRLYGNVDTFENKWQILPIMHADIGELNESFIRPGRWRLFFIGKQFLLSSGGNSA
jgi:hypothetical protein